MWPDEPFAEGRGSFLRPVPIPSGAVDAPPTQTIVVSCAWLPYIRGALQQLLLQATWDTANPAALLDVQGRTFNLIDLFQECSEPPAWSCPYDFTVSGAGEDGFIAENDGSPWSPGFAGEFIGGTGWATTLEVDTSTGVNRVGLQITKNLLTPVNIDGVQAVFNVGKGIFSGYSLDNYLQCGNVGAGHYETLVWDSSTEPDGVNEHHLTFTAFDVDFFRIRLWVGGEVSTDPGGAGQVLSWAYNKTTGGC